VFDSTTDVSNGSREPVEFVVGKAEVTAAPKAGTEVVLTTHTRAGAQVLRPRLPKHVDWRGDPQRHPLRVHALSVLPPPERSDLV